MKRRVALVGFAIGVAACGGVKRPAPEAPELAPSASAAAVAPGQSAAAPEAADAGAAPDAAPRPPSLARRVELREAGREPRRVLRHAFVAGSKHALRVVVSARVTADRRPVSGVELRAPLDVEIVQLTADSAAVFHYALGPIANASPSPAGAAVALRSDISAGTKVSGTATMTADGQLTERRLDPPTSESAPEAELVKSLLATALELPEQPVGQGARWDVVLEASSDELGLTRTTSYELLGFAGAAARLRVSQTEQVRMPDGGVVNPLAEGSNSGEWLLRTAQPFAEGRQKLRQAVPTESGRGELATELSIAPRK